MSEKPNRFRIISVTIMTVMVMANFGLLTNSLSNNVSVLPSYDAVSGYATGHSGSPLYIYIQNGLLNLSEVNGYWSLKSFDGNIAVNNFAWGLITNNSGYDVYSSSYWLYDYLGYFSNFTDALGSGIQYRIMYWTSPATTLNVSYYFKVYDDESFILTWAEVRNPFTWNVNFSQCQLQSYYSYASGTSGLKVGSQTSNMWWWDPTSPSNSIWKGNASSASAEARDYRQPPLVIVTNSLTKSALTIGQVTENFGGPVITIVLGSHNSEAYGAQQMTLSMDRQAAITGAWPVEKFAPSTNWTSDIGFFGITNSNDVNPALSDWGQVVLTLNTLKSEMTKFTGGLFTTWNNYPHNITDTDVRNLADFISINCPGIEWLQIDDGWQIGSSQAGSQNQKDTLAMEVDTAKFPNMTDTVNYIHSKGLKFALWVDPTRMWDHGAMNASHPGWRLRNADSTPYNSTFATGKCYHADITHPGFLAYLSAQLTSMQATWGVDGFKVDFIGETYANKLWYNWNISAVHSQRVFFGVIANATSTCELITTATPLTWNPLTSGIFSNVFRTGPDIIGDYASFKNSVTNYSIRYFLLRNAGGDDFPILDMDQVSSAYYGGSWSADILTQTTDFWVAMGAVAQVSFYPGNNPTYFNIVNRMIAAPDYSGFFYISGQNGADHQNYPMAYGRNTSQPTADFNPIKQIVILNFDATSAIFILDGNDFGLINPSSMIVHFIHNDTMTDISQNGSISISAYSSIFLEIVLTHYYYYPAAIQPLVMLIYSMFVIGVIVSIIGGAVLPLRNKKMTQQQMITHMIHLVMYIVIAMALIASVYRLFIGR